MITDKQLALLWAIEQRAGQSGDATVICGIEVVTLTAVMPLEGLTVRADWPVLLKCSEAEILEALAGWFYRRVDELGEQIAGCGTEGSKAMAVAVRLFRRSEYAAAMAKAMAAETWVAAQAGPEALSEPDGGMWLRAREAAGFRCASERVPRAGSG